MSFYFERSNFCKDNRDKTEVPDPLVLEDPISDKLNFEENNSVSIFLSISVELLFNISPSSQTRKKYP